MSTLTRTLPPASEVSRMIYHIIEFCLRGQEGSREFLFQGIVDNSTLELSNTNLLTQNRKNAKMFIFSLWGHRYVP